MPRTEPHSKPTKRPQKGPSGKQTTPKKMTAVRRMSSEELSRHEREVRANRMILASMGVLAVLVIAVLAFGWWREYVAKGSESVATVAGRPISVESYGSRLDFRRKSVEQQIQFMQAQLQSSSTGGGGEALADLFRQQIQQLQFSLLLLPEQALQEMIDEELIRQEAGRRGLTVSPEEIDAETRETFGDQPTPVPEPSATPGPAIAGQPTATPPPAPTPGPSPTPLPTADVEARLSGFLTVYDISMADYRNMIESQLLRDKLQQAMGAEVPTAEEQARARHILVETEEKARELLAKLKDGASFEELARAESTDPSAKENGGDLGWFSRGRMVPEFDTVVFELAPGQLSEPVKTSFGWHIIEVLEKDPNRQLEEPELSSRKNAAISDWLQTARTSPEVERELTENQKNWVFKKIEWRPNL